MTVRDRQLLDLCHLIPECQIRIPNVCKGYSVGGCEPCHGNWQWVGIGMSHKAADIPAAGCHDCHVELDDRANLTRDDKEKFWARGAIRTMIIFFERGWLRVLPNAKRIVA